MLNKQASFIRQIKDDNIARENLVLLITLWNNEPQQIIFIRINRKKIAKIDFLLSRVGNEHWNIEGVEYWNQKFLN